jgi:hypothetical protein
LDKELIELNSNSIKENCYADWWKIYSISSCEYVVGKKYSIYTYEKTPFHSFSIGNELTNSNLELSNVQRFEEPKIV